MAFTEIRPMLEVKNMDETLAFYQNKLGFELVDRMNDEWANLRRGQVYIMFTRRYSQDVHPAPVMTGGLYIYTESVDELWQELKEEIEIAYPLETFTYGMREFAIYDCNGYMLQFGQEAG